MAFGRTQSMSVNSIRHGEASFTMGEADEAACIERAMVGDRSAIDWLITRYRTRVVRLTVSILRHSGEAEDAAQETFVRAFRSLQSYRNDGKFYTWLYTIAVRVCLDRRRAADWTHEVDAEYVSEIAASTDGSYTDVELRVLVESLLDQLTPPMRAMIVLRELEGLEYAEIASVLRIPVGRVRWRLHEARRRFQELWTKTQQETDNV